MGVLKDSLCYLAGPIQFVNDDGVQWRKIFKDRCKDIGIKFLDPTDKSPALQKEIHEQKDHQNKLLEDGLYKELSSMMKIIVRQDLRCVDISDFIVAKISINTHACGTYNEIFLAISQKKPVLIIVEDGKEKCPFWLFGVINPDFIFSSEEDCLGFLNKVDKKLVELDDKWVLVRKDLECL